MYHVLALLVHLNKEKIYTVVYHLKNISEL